MIQRLLGLMAAGEILHQQQAELLRQGIQMHRLGAQGRRLGVLLRPHQLLHQSAEQPHEQGAIVGVKIGTPQLVGRIRQEIPLIQIGGLPAQCPELLRVGGLQRPAGQILKDIHIQPCIGSGNPAVQAVFVADHALGVGKAQCSHGVACPAGVILQGAGGIAAAAVGPQKVDEFRSGDAPIPVQDQVGHQRPQPPGTAGETDHLGLLHAGLLQGKPPQHRGPDVCDLSHNQPPLWGAVLCPGPTLRSYHGGTRADLHPSSSIDGTITISQFKPLVTRKF